MFTLLLLLQLSSTSPPSTADILATVSKNVREFQELLPDFVCNEKITSTASESGRVRQARTVESIFTATQKPGPAPHGRSVFTETREITAIDGTPARKGAKMPRLPFAMFGGFGALLSMTFSPQNLQEHNYMVDGVVDGGAQIAVHFATREGQREIRTLLDGEGLINKDDGMAWIDSKSMQVVRLRRDFLSLPRTLSQLRNTVEYGPTTIGDHEFWLPRMMRTDATERDRTKTKTFVAEYTNCKKFVAEIRILQ